MLNTKLTGKRENRERKVFEQSGGNDNTMMFALPEKSRGVLEMINLVTATGKQHSKNRFQRI